MLTGTLLAIFYIPLFFVIVRRTARDTMKKLHDIVEHHHHPDGEPAE